MNPVIFLLVIMTLVSSSLALDLHAKKNETYVHSRAEAISANMSLYRKCIGQWIAQTDASGNLVNFNTVVSGPGFLASTQVTCPQMDWFTRINGVDAWIAPAPQGAWSASGQPTVFVFYEPQGDDQHIALLQSYLSQKVGSTFAIGKISH